MWIIFSCRNLALFAINLLMVLGMLVCMSLYIHSILHALLMSSTTVILRAGVFFKKKILQNLLKKKSAKTKNTFKHNT